METTKGITTEIITITPAIAEAFLLANTSNRPVNTGNVDRIAAAIKRGEWKLNNDAICFSKDGALINGQHRCYAVIKTGQSVPVLVIRGLEESSFLTMDQGGKLRGGADALAMAGVSQGNRVSTAITLLHYWIHGYGSHGGCKMRVSPSIVIDLYRKHPGIHDSVIIAGTAKYVITPTVLGFCHYVMSRVDAEKADRFVFMLATGADLPERHPVLALRNRLIENKTSRAKIQRFHLVSLIFRAWNYYIAKKPVRCFPLASLKNVTIKGDALWNSAND